MRAARALAGLLPALIVVSCSTWSDQALLTQFFAASRLRDLTALSKLSSVVFEPAVDGIVTSFEITDRTVNESGARLVSIAAPVRLPVGRTVAKRFVVAIERGQITAVSERPALNPGEAPASPSTPRT